MTLEQPTSPQEDLPDWLKNLRREQGAGEEGDEFDRELADAPTQEMPAVDPGGESGADEEAEEGSEDAGELPDWLAKIRDAEEQHEPASAETPGFQQQAGEDASEDDDWLESLRAQNEEDDTDDQADEEAVQGQGDFLERIRQIKASEGQSEEDQEADRLANDIAPAEEEAKTPQDVPDWLSGISAERAESQGPAEADSGAFEDLPLEDVRENVREDVSAQEGKQEGEADATSAAASVEAEFPGLPGAPTGDLPAWLADLQQSTAFPDPDEPPALVVDEEDEEDETDQQMEEVLEDALPDEAPPSPPEWVGLEESAAGDDDPGLKPADLPEWLQAMRPSGATSPAKTRPLGDAGAQETVGPLAGLRSVLPAEPEVVRFGKMPEFSGKLYVTEGQKANAALFENLIREESEGVAEVPGIASLPRRILRFIVAGILFFSLLIPVFSGSVSVPLPSLIFSNEEDRLVIPLRETKDANDIVNDLGQGSPVLLIFDYQPGLSGEMDAALSAVVDHLLLQGAQLSLVSTNPTGASLGQFFLARTQASHDPVFTNLGYLAGGASALQGFAQNPGGALPAMNAENLNDFALLVVITDDPDAARSWIEQVQPALADPATGQNLTPMIAVTSAQAEPFIRPYYESSPRQISGLVSGVLGGAYYENALGRSHAARTYWNALSWGLTTAVVLIVIGGFYHLALQLLKRRPSRQQGLDQ